MKDIKLLREERGMSQRKLAKESSLSQTTISKIESGMIKEPSIHTITCLANGLKVKVTDLLND